jgi:hypothetical protein
MTPVVQFSVLDVTAERRVRGSWEKSSVPDRPLVRVPIRTLLEYSYELGV